MKKLAFAFLLLGSAVFAQKQEKRQVGDFSGVQVSQSIQLDFTYGESKSVEVFVQDEKEMEYVKTEVKNGVLQVYIETPKGLFNYKMSRIQVQVSNPTLAAAYVSSSGTFNVNNNVISKDFKVTTSSSGKFFGKTIQTDNLEVVASSSSKIEGTFAVANNTSLEASSSAKIDVNLKANKLDVVASSSAKIEMEGTAKTATAKVSSSGKIDGTDFAIRTLDGKASSSGSMSFNVAEEVKGKASSSGKIAIYGTASLIEATKSSGGKVEKVK